MKHARRLALVAAFATFVAGERAFAQEAPGPGTYVFDVTVAPVCLEGTFPISITTAEGTLSGSLLMSMAGGSKLTGSLSIGGRTYDVSGSQSFSAKGFKVSLTAKDGESRRDRTSLTFSGTLSDRLFTGTVVGKGRDGLALGKNTFTLDVGDADPLTASFVAVLVAGKRGALSGGGTATICGEPTTLKAKGSTTKKFSVKFTAKGLKFTAGGTSTVDWKFSGLGASSTGTELTLAPLPAPTGLAYGVTDATFEDEEPIVADYPTTFMPPLTTFSVDPALPAGIVLDARTGVVSGTPAGTAAATTYTITASNAAGSSQATIRFDVRINKSKSFAPEQNALIDDDLRHFLRRTQFGVRAAELTALRSQSLSTYVDAMLVFPGTTSAETNANAILVHTTDPPGLEGQFPTNNDLARRWLQIMADTPAPFQETLAFFWHDHFGVSSANFDGSEKRWMVTHVDLLRDEGAGNLRTLLLDVSKDPAMLKFLDGVVNRAGANRVNENYAREFWELFTLGVGNGYTQQDIMEAARAWTGYQETADAQTGLNSVVQNASRHDTAAKTFFGVTIPAGQTIDQDYASVVDITLANRPVAEYVGKKLFEFFCYENPPQSVIDAMAGQIRGANYELAPVLKSLFLSEAFFSKKARRSLVKSPLDFTMGFVRSTGLRPTTSSASNPAFDVASLDTSLNNQGQRPTQPPTVAGWPSGDLWLSAQGMVERINVVHVCVDDTTDQNRLGINVAALLPPVAQRTADAVVDTLAGLLDVQLSTQDRADMVTYLNTTRDAAGNVTTSAFDGSVQAQLDERVRGLLYVLAQHPTYHSR
jgi:uncharacterized protein (DUF1800 family)